MLVKELIDKLQTFDPHKQISIFEINSESWLALDNISQDKELDAIQLTVENHIYDEKSFTVRDLKKILSNYSNDAKIGFFDVMRGNFSFIAEIDDNKKNLIFNIL